MISLIKGKISGKDTLDSNKEVRSSERKFPRENWEVRDNGMVSSPQVIGDTDIIIVCVTKPNFPVPIEEKDFHSGGINDCRSTRLLHTENN